MTAVSQHSQMKTITKSVQYSVSAATDKGCVRNAFVQMYSSFQTMYEMSSSQKMYEMGGLCGSLDTRYKMGVSLPSLQATSKAPHLIPCLEAAPNTLPSRAVSGSYY